MKERMSLKVARAVLLIVMMLMAFYAFSKDKEPAVLSLKGEIMDSQCAFNVHSYDRSHEAMTKKGIYGGDAKSCTLHCVKDVGGSYVLLVKDRVYRLDDQVQPEQFSGKKVKVTGTLDAKGETLHVLKMEEDK